MNLFRIAARVAGRVANNDSAMLDMLAKLEARERNHGRDPGQMSVEERFFNPKNYPANMRSSLPKDATVEILAKTESGTTLTSGIGKTREDAVADLMKQMKKLLWR